MPSKILLTEEPIFKGLEKYLKENGELLNIYNLLKQNPQRFETFRYFFSLMMLYLKWTVSLIFFIYLFF